jgi:hypothetical protein
MRGKQVGTFSGRKFLGSQSKDNMFKLERVKASKM